MKKILILCAIVVAGLSASCDKVTNAYPTDVFQSGLDTNLYPGNFGDYVTPLFGANTNTNRNVLIEDFTGHQCTYCPPAAATAHSLEVSNPERVFVSTIHSGPTGITNFQETVAPTFTYDFTNPVSLEIGKFFGSYPNNSFGGNPSGNVSRIPGSNGSISSDKSEWPTKTTTLLNDNLLKVNIQSVVNYFPTTKGAFIHIEVENLSAITNELRLVVAFYEDSIVKPQKDFSGTIYDYVHRDLLKAHINGNMIGQKVDETSLNANGKHYFEMSYKIPDEYTAENSHLLIYVFDKVTNEIYQVIKKEFI